MEKKNDIVEIHLLTNKATETCKLVVYGEGADLVSLIVEAMSQDDTLILDHKN